jgi:Tol biopolymer transport system component
MRARYLYIVVAALAAARTAIAQPTPFAPSLFPDSTQAIAPAFARDCKTVWFTNLNAAGEFIVSSRFDHGQWTPPTPVPFSSTQRDLEGAMSPDGSFLIFASSRPFTPGAQPPDGTWGGAPHPGRGGNLWRVNRHGNDWGTPERLPDVVNQGTNVFSPSVLADGSLYFMMSQGKRFEIYRSQFSNGQYQQPVLAPFSDEQWGNVDATVAPDESFAVFASNRPPTAKGDLDLFIVFRVDGTWGTPVSLGPTVNSPSGETEPHLAPDGHTLFFSSSRAGPNRIYRVDLAPWLKTRPRGGCSVPA